VKMLELNLREHGAAVSAQLTPGQRDALLALDAGLDCRPVAGSLERYDVRAGSKVGVVQLPGLRLTIEPKLSVRRVLYLLFRSGASSTMDRRLADVGESVGLYEALASLYADLLGEGLRRGLPEGYRSRDDALPAIRGRVRFGDQIRRQRGLALPVEVQFDDFTEDIELNRILKAAATVLVAGLRPPSEARARLRRLLAGLTRVRSVVFDPRSVPSPVIDRRTEHLRDAASLARLVLCQKVTELAGRGAPARGLLFDMDRVFEGYLHRELGRQLGLSDRDWPAGARARAVHLDLDRRIRLLPDLTWWRSGRCVFVGDAKYKQLSSDSLPRGDVYQMVSYLVGTGLRQGLLVYGGGGGGPGRYRLREAGREVLVERIDLSGDVAALEAEVGRLVGVVRGMVAEGGQIPAGALDQPW